MPNFNLKSISKVCNLKTSIHYTYLRLTWKNKIFQCHSRAFMKPRYKAVACKLLFGNSLQFSIVFLCPLCYNFTIYVLISFASLVGELWPRRKSCYCYLRLLFDLCMIEAECFIGYKSRFSFRQCEIRCQCCHGGWRRARRQTRGHVTLIKAGSRALTADGRPPL